MVYFIQQGCNGAIKIGHTSNTAQQRLEALQSANPEQLFILGTLAGTSQYELELQEKFYIHNIRGEWFYPHTSLLRFISDNCDDVRDLAKLKFDVFSGCDGCMQALV